MKVSPKFAGFAQAAGVAVYIILFAITAQNLQARLVVNKTFVAPAVAIAGFLLAFVVSALVCGFLVLAYPLYLFFGGGKNAALKVLLWSGLWLVVFLVAILLFGFR